MGAATGFRFSCHRQSRHNSGYASEDFPCANGDIPHVLDKRDRTVGPGPAAHAPETFPCARDGVHADNACCAEKRGARLGIGPSPRVAGRSHRVSVANCIAHFRNRRAKPVVRSCEIFGEYQASAFPQPIPPPGAHYSGARGGGCDARRAHIGRRYRSTRLPLPGRTPMGRVSKREYSRRPGRKSLKKKPLPSQRKGVVSWSHGLEHERVPRRMRQRSGISAYFDGSMMPSSPWASPPGPAEKLT